MSGQVAQKEPEESGKIKAITMSYDDGSVHYERLVDLFNRYGIKGNVSSAF